MLVHPACFLLRLILPENQSAALRQISKADIFLTA
jgi:hypothetical protein